MTGCCKEDKNQTKIIVGIDFGTTNCLIGHSTNGFDIQYLGEKALIPSQITIIDGVWLFGNEIDTNKNIVKSIKRIIGLTLSQILTIQHQLPYTIDIKNSTEDCVRVFIGWNSSSQSPYSMSVDEIVMAMMTSLKKIILKSLALTAIDTDIDAVITVPAYFDDKARNIIKKAAILSGINVIRLINEPTAAALAYNQKLEENKNYLVYDLGGGTFDVSVVRKYQNNLFRVMGVGGDKYLGGDDFDNALADFLISKFDFEIDNRFDFLSAVKKFKEDFYYGNKFFTYNNAKIDLSNEEFEEILLPIINRTIAIVDNVISDFVKKNIQINYNIDGIILVGGSTRLKLIHTILHEKFSSAKTMSCSRPCSQETSPRKILCELNPDEVVVHGATIHSYELINKSKNHLLIDVVSMSIGLETGKNSVEKLIPKNSQIPIKKKQVFTTQIDNQKSMRIAICQGESDKFDENIFLGKFILSDLPEAKAGFLEIEIVFSLDSDGILTISAEEKTTKVALFVVLNQNIS